MIKQSIINAENSISSGDVVEMLEVYKALELLE